MSRKLPISILIALLLVGGLELAVRQVEGRIRDSLEWPDWEAQNKVERMNLIRRRGRQAAVVVVGTSMTHAAVDPRMLATKLNVPLTFNAALNGSDMRSLELWTLGVVVPNLKPRIVVIEASSAVLNDNGLTQEEFWELFKNSRRGSRLAGTGGAPAAIQRWFESRFALVRHRSALRQPFRAFTPSADQTAFAVNAQGVSFLVQGRGRRILTYSIPEIFRDRTVNKTLHNYAAGGEQLAALSRLVRGLQALGITVVLADMPQTSDAIELHPGKERDYAKYTTVLQRFVSTHPNIQFVDMRGMVGGDTVLFRDPVHMNTRGTQRFTELLAEALRPVLAATTTAR